MRTFGCTSHSPFAGMWQRWSCTEAAQTIEALAHVGSARRQPYAIHRALESSAHRTRSERHRLDRSPAASTDASARTRAPDAPGQFYLHHEDRRVGRVGTTARSASTASRRNRNRKLGARPLRRVTAEVVPPFCVTVKIAVSLRATTSAACLEAQCAKNPS